MSLRDFSLFVVMCLIWAFNTIAAKLVVADMQVPPLFYALVRSAAIALAVLPWLLPMPRPRWRVVLVGLLMGGGGFSLLFIGLKTSSPSAASVVTQLGVPVATVLSVFVLGEKIRWRRGIGIVLTVAGVFVVMLDPAELDFSTGLLFVAASTIGGAVATIMMKQMDGVSPLKYQAWLGFSSTILLVFLTSIFEQGQVGAALRAGWPFVGAVLFSALLVSVFAHTMYYWMVQRYEANLVAPLTLMAPLMTIGLGVWLTGDRFDVRMAMGAALALAGVFIIAVRPNEKLGRKLIFRGRL